MGSEELVYLSAIDLIAHYGKGDLSPVDVAEAVLRRIERVDPVLNAFVTVTPEQALADARAAEQAWRDGSAGALCGVPISIKDLTPTRGIRTTRGSAISPDWVPDYDAPFVERAKAAGSVMLGKTNTPEFGWKGESSNPVSGTSHNPWKLDRTPGGSSGGGSAAVAAGLGPLAQGSDGAGSIRIPCGFSGIFGHKPSFGLVPQYPPSALGDISHLGPMTRTVRDAALLMNVTAGGDPRDRLSWSSGLDYVAALDGASVKGLRVAWSPDLGYAKVEPEIAALAAKAAKVFSDLGAEVVEVDPGIPDPWPIIDVMWAGGMAAMHRDDLEQVRHLIDPGRLRIIEECAKLGPVDIAATLPKRSDYYQRWRSFMDGYDLLLTPTLPCEAFQAGLDNPETLLGEPTTYLGWTVFTYPFNLTGQPAATVPAGFTTSGLPAGLQIVGRWHDDAGVLRAAAAFEEAAPWAQVVPKLLD